MLDKLVARQRALGLSDREFAARLGIPRQTWTATRLSIRQLGPRVCRAASRAFPDMRDDLAFFVLSDATNEADDDTFATAGVA